MFFLFIFLNEQCKMFIPAKRKEPPIVLAPRKAAWFAHFSLFSWNPMILFAQFLLHEFRNICITGCQFLSLILYNPVSTSICKFLILTLLKAPFNEKGKKTAFPCNILVLNMDCYLTHLFGKRVIFVGYPSKEIYKSISSV